MSGTTRTNLVQNDAKKVKFLIRTLRSTYLKQFSLAISKMGQNLNFKTKEKWRIFDGIWIFIQCNINIDSKARFPNDSLDTKPNYLQF